MIRCSTHPNLERRRRFMEAYSGLDRTRHDPLAYCASTSRSLIACSVATSGSRSFMCLVVDSSDARSEDRAAKSGHGHVARCDPPDAITRSDRYEGWHLVAGPAAAETN